MTVCDVTSFLQELPEANPEVEKYIIPVVFHIIHDGEDENISDDAVRQLVDNINLEFGGGSFNLGYNTNIEFCLAKVGPNNECTDGIVRKQDSLTVAPLQLDEFDPNPSPVQELSRWDPSKYLNIWLVREFENSQFISGYSSFPFIPISGREGIVAVSDGSALFFAHELGHFLGLLHVNGCGGGCIEVCGKNQNEADKLGDFVDDTNPAFTADPLETCYTECGINFEDLPYPAENYMTVATVASTVLPNSFTAGQSKRMYYHLNTVQRDLWFPSYNIRKEMTVNKPTKVHKDIEIFAGGRLEIESEVVMAEGTSIIVHQGGQLVVDGGHIRGCDISDTERGLWNGITMRGRNQEGFDVELINHSTIEDVDGFAVKTQVNFDPITFQIRDNGRLNAIDTEFNNVGGLAQLAAIFARPNNSHIEDCILNGGEVGISSTNCWDIAVIDNEFLEIEKECIKGSNGSFLIEENDFYAGETDVALTYLLANVRSEIRNNRFFGSRGGIRVVGNTFDANLILDNIFIQPEQANLGDVDIYADGASHYSISNNNFSGSIGVSSRANGESINEVIENEFIQNLVGIYPHDGNPNYTFFRNCFSTHIVDASIFGKVANQIPNDGTHANNCFTHQGGLLNFPFYQNDIGGEPEPFDYSEPDDNNQDCRDAFLSHPNVFRDFDGIDEGNVCDAFRPEGEEGETEENEDSEIEEHLRNQNYTQLETISQNQGGIEGRLLSYSIEMLQGNYPEARSALDFSMFTDQVGTEDLSYVLNLYTDILETPGNTEILLQNNKQQLEDIAQNPHPYSAYAQSLYFMLTGEFVENLDLSIIEPFNAIGERSNLVSDPIIEQKTAMFYPNPSKNVVTISNAQSIASLNVYNSLGELIYTTNKVNEILDIQTWQIGLYFFDVETQDNTRTLVKFIKSE